MKKIYNLFITLLLLPSIITIIIPLAIIINKKHYQRILELILKNETLVGILFIIYNIIIWSIIF